MDKTENEKNLIKWTLIIQKCRSSGIGVRPWCRDNNVSEKQFYYRERLIKGKDFETAKANNLKPYNYFELLLTEIPKRMEDTNLEFIEDLLPWSEKLPVE